MAALIHGGMRLTPAFGACAFGTSVQTNSFTLLTRRSGMNNPRDKAVEVEPGQGRVNPAEEIRRIEDDVRANKGIGRTVQPRRDSETEKELEEDTGK
jgi:hypothetical protein